ncbi:MAG: putative Ig domain-containing protein [Trebonia sp.]
MRSALLAVIQQKDRRARPGTEVRRRARYRRRAARARLPRVAGRRSRAPASRLPPGLSVGKGGTVGGTITPAAAPKAAVTYWVTVLVKNGAGATATAAFSWRVSPA